MVAREGTRRGVGLEESKARDINMNMERLSESIMDLKGDYH